MRFTSPLNPAETFSTKFFQIHGDAVRDIAIRVNDCRIVYSHAISAGAKSIEPPAKYSNKNGSVIMASLQTYGDTIHTLIEYINYKGPLLLEPYLRGVGQRLYLQNCEATWHRSCITFKINTM